MYRIFHNVHLRNLRGKCTFLSLDCIVHYSYTRLSIVENLL